MKDISREAALLYEGTFRAFEFLPIEDEETGIVSLVKSEYITDAPCRLSFSQTEENKQSRFPSYKSVKARLFTSPELAIKSGSEISVRQNGIELEFISSGSPAVYKGHQEVALKLKNVG